jgi:hypothetical protein
MSKRVRKAVFPPIRGAARPATFLAGASDGQGGCQQRTEELFC